MTDKENDYLFNNQNMTLHVIAKTVADHYGVDVKKMFERTRKREFVEKRYMFFAVAMMLTNDWASLSKIGRFCKATWGIKHYDHSTVIHGINTIKDLRTTNILMENDYQVLISKLKPVLLRTRKESEAFKDKKLSVVLRIMGTTSNDDLQKEVSKLLNSDFFRPSVNTLV